MKAELSPSTTLGMSFMLQCVWYSDWEQEFYLVSGSHQFCDPCQITCAKGSLSCLTSSDLHSMYQLSEGKYMPSSLVILILYLSSLLVWRSIETLVRDQQEHLCVFPQATFYCLALGVDQVRSQSRVARKVEQLERDKGFEGVNEEMIMTRIRAIKWVRRSCLAWDYQRSERGQQIVRQTICVIWKDRKWL